MVQSELIATGYVRGDDVMLLSENNYSVFEHEEKPPVRLYWASGELTDHDVEDHRRNSLF